MSCALSRSVRTTHPQAVFTAGPVERVKVILRRATAKDSCNNGYSTKGALHQKYWSRVNYWLIPKDIPARGWADQSH